MDSVIFFKCLGVRACVSSCSAMCSLQALHGSSARRDLPTSTGLGTPWVGWGKHGLRHGAQPLPQTEESSLFLHYLNPHEKESSCVFQFQNWILWKLISYTYLGSGSSVLCVRLLIKAVPVHEATLTCSASVSTSLDFINLFFDYITLFNHLSQILLQIAHHLPKLEQTK